MVMLSEGGIGRLSAEQPHQVLNSLLAEGLAVDRRTQEGKAVALHDLLGLEYEVHPDHNLSVVSLRVGNLPVPEVVDPTVATNTGVGIVHPALNPREHEDEGLGVGCVPIAREP